MHGKFKNAQYLPVNQRRALRGGAGTSTSNARPGGVIQFSHFYESITTGAQRGTQENRERRRPGGQAGAQRPGPESRRRARAIVKPQLEQ